MSSDISENNQLKRIELWIGFLKFTFGTVVLGAATLLLNHQFQSNQLDLERTRSAHEIELEEKKAEFEYLSKFITHAMNEDLEVRIRLADYMQSAALSGSIKKIWTNYHIVLTEQKAEAIAKHENLKNQELELVAKLNDAHQRNEAEKAEWMLQISEVQKEILYVQDQLDRRKYGSFSENYVDTYELYQKGNLLIIDGNYDDAIQIFRQGLAAGNKATEYLFLTELASAFRAKREFKMALSYAIQAAKLKPKNKVSLQNLAIMQKNNGDLAGALKSLNEAKSITEGMDRIEIQLIQAGYLIHAGRRNSGISLYNSIASSISQYPSLELNHAWFLAVAGVEDSLYKDKFFRLLELALSNDIDNMVMNWIDIEVDLDHYRKDPKFINLIN